MVRGISGGEKKRLTVGEGLLTNARVLLMEYEYSDVSYVRTCLNESYIYGLQ